MAGFAAAILPGQEALFTIQPASSDYPSAGSGSAADRRVGSLRPTKQPDHRRPRSGDPSGQRAASRAPTRRTAMARSYGGARSSSSAGIGGAGVVAARAVMDQRSESEGGTAQHYQLALPESGVAAPALHLGAWVNASPPGAHGEVQDVGEQDAVEGLAGKVHGVVVARDEVDPIAKPEALGALLERRQDLGQIDRCDVGSVGALGHGQAPD